MPLNDATLPVPGGSEDSWGSLLNLYLTGLNATKADISVVTAALALKADLTALALKADATALAAKVDSSTYVAGLALKADASALAAKADASALSAKADVSALAAKADATTVTALTTSTAKQSFTIGDGSTTSFNLTHTKATRDVDVTIVEVSTYSPVIAQWSAISTTQVNVAFQTAPATNAIRVSIR